MTKNFKIGDHLKRSVPEFQQGNKHLDSFLDAAGTFLDRLKTSIERLDVEKDYKQASNAAIIRHSSELGMDMPRGLSDNIKRKAYRDLSSINLKQGTMDDLKLTMQLIGLDADIRNAWLPAPADYYNGYLTDVVTGEKRPYDPTYYVYNEFLYGNEVTKESGTYFEGYRFNDGLQENIIKDIPIYGEVYKKMPENKIPVAKTPYVIVRFNEGNFNLIDSVYIDPETGVEYTRSAQEEFQLINEIIRYYTRDGRRPSTIRVVIVVTLHHMNDDIEIEEYLEQEISYNDDGGDSHSDVINLECEVRGKTSVSLVNWNIGVDGLHIGPTSPFKDALTVIPTASIGTDESSPEALLEWPEVVSENMYFTMTNGESVNYSIRALTELEVTGNSIDVYGVIDESTEILLESFDVSGMINFPDYTYDQIIFRSPDESIKVKSTMSAWSQG